MTFDRIARKAIFTWQHWWRCKRLSRKCPTFVDITRKEADERRRHGRPGVYAKEKQKLMTDLLAGRMVR